MRKSRVFIIAGILVVALFNAGCNVSIEKREPSKNTVSSGINNLATNTKNASNVKTNTNIKEEVNSTINVKESETKNIKKMQIECGVSGIKIVPEKRNDIEANLIGTVVNCTWDKSEPLSYKVSGDTLTIDVNNKNGNSNNSFQGNSINLDLTVYVPDNLIENIDVLNGVGDLDVSKNTLENLNIAIGVGKLVGIEFAGNVSGEIGVGDVVLQFEKFEDTSIDMSLGTGNAKVTLPKGSEFDIDATTGVGEIKCDFDVKRAGKEPEVSFMYDELKGSVGNGNSNINLETGVGEISIKKK